MNQHRHNMIFTAPQFAKTAQTAVNSTAVLPPQARQLKPLALQIMLALGLSLASQPLWAQEMQIRADKSVAGELQPTVLNSANGIPQVNIQTPSAAGVSRNVYSQFDVSEKGAVLNNARQAAQTQLAGWVQGNPNLVGGEAKVILNEVNSSDPSQLKGYVEVAGKKADVVIANPSGIHCEGCGVINAGRTSFSTGKAVVEQGKLQGFEAPQGEILVRGKGMDNRAADYTEIISSRAQVEGGIWANELKVVTGKNPLKRNGTGESVVHMGSQTGETAVENNAVSTGSSTGSDNGAYALDISALGGMYANQIYLIDKGTGLGVRNAGHIGAQAGEVQIDSVGRIVNQGKIQAKQDIELKARQQIHNQAKANIVAQQGSVQLNTAKQLEQQGSIGAKTAVKITAVSLNQQASGEIQAGNVHINAQQEIINRGLINSKSAPSTSQTHLRADNIQNIGTGRIYGDHIALGATRIENLDEQTTAQTERLASAVIAARSRLDLGAQHILNQSRYYSGNSDSATTLLSLGQLSVGASLDANAQAQGNAQSLQNRSALIQAKQAQLNVASLLNQNDFFATELKVVFETPVNWQYIVPKGEAESELRLGLELLRRYSQSRGRDGYLLKNLPAQPDKPSNGDAQSYLLPEVSQCTTADCEIAAASYYLPQDPAWKVFGIRPQIRQNISQQLQQAQVPVAPVEPSKPRGSDPQAQQAYQQALAEYQQKLAQYQQQKQHFDEVIKPIYVQWMQDNQTQFAQLADAVNKHNRAIRAYGGRKIPDYWITSLNKEVVRETTVTQTQPAKILVDGDLSITAENVVNDKSQILVGGTLQLLGAELNNINAQGEQYVDSYGSSHYSYLKKRKSKTASGRSKWKRVNNNHRSGLLSSQMQSITLPVALSFANYDFQHQELANPDNGSELPQPSSALYKLNPEADNRPLVETDPAFTDQRKWLSSDYMFHMLRVEPQFVLKRLGDGYYEQQLLRQQFQQRTGFTQFVSQGENFEQQYKRLMDNGVSFAQQFHLRPGIALSKEQVAQLTSDIVWFEPQNLRLADGRLRQVLVPKLYLAKLQPQDLKTNGSLISAQNILITSQGNVQNQAQIAGRNLALIEARNVENSGKINAKSTAVVAHQNLRIQGGSLSAQDALSLQAGNELVLQSTSAQSQVKGRGYLQSQQQLDRQAALYVKGENGELHLAANNIQLQAAQIINNGKGSTAILAENQLHINGLSLENVQQRNADSNHRKSEKNTQVVATQIRAQGDIQLQANQIEMQAAQVESAKQLNVSAKQNIDLTTQAQSLEFEEYHKSTTKGAISRSSTESYKQLQQQQQQGAVLRAANIALSAQNIGLKATQLHAKQDIQLQAQQHIDIAAATDVRISEQWEKHKKSGLTGSLKGGTAQFGYQRSKSSFEGKNYDESLQASQLISQGNLRLTANQDLKVAASQLSAKGDMLLVGQNVQLASQDEQHNSRLQQSFKSSGFGVGMVYNPVAKAQDNYRQKQQQGGTQSIVGKGLSAADAAVDSLDSTLRGIQPYFRHQQSQSNKSQQKTVAKHTAVEVGGALKVEAKAGDIALQGSHIAVEGNAQFIAANHLNVGVAEHRQNQQANSKQKGFSIDGLAKYVVGINAARENGSAQWSQQQGAQIAIGGDSLAVAKTGDISLTGSRWVAEGKNQFIAAEGNIRLDTAKTQQQSSQMRKGHSVGEAVISETERFAGYNRTRFNQDSNAVSHQGNQIASLNNQIAIWAAKEYAQTASELLAKDKISISAQSVQLENAINQNQFNQSESDLKIGQFSRIKSPILDMITAVENQVKNPAASERLKAAGLLSLAAQGYSLYDTASNVLNKNPTQAYLFRAESGVGVAHSRQSQALDSRASVGNLLNAKQIDVQAREGDLRAVQTDFTSNDSQGKRQADSLISLRAQDNLLLQAGESEQKQRARSQNAGVEVGTAVTVGAQTGWSFYGKVGFGNQKQDGEQRTYHNSHLDSESIQLISGKDTALRGAVARAQQIQTQAGGELRIESLQDSASFSQRGMSAGVQVEFGFGNSWNFSANASAERGQSNFKQVREQSGLFAESGGYQVEADNVHLKGAAIASTNAEKSELRTNQLQFEDIQNTSSHSASSGAISGGYGKGADYYQDNASGKVVSESYAKTQPNLTALVKPEAQTNFGGGMPMHSQDSEQSLTKATLTEGKIILNKDSQPTITSAAALGINTGLANANSQVAQPKDVATLLNQQKQMTAAVGQIVGAVNTYTNNRAREAQKAAQQAQQALELAQASGDAEKIAEKTTAVLSAQAEAKKWESGGEYKRTVDTVTTVLTGILANQSAGAIATNALSPKVNELIKQATTNEKGEVDKVSNSIAHAIWGAIEAAANQGNISAGAIAAASSELAAPMLAKALYGTDNPAELTAEQKHNLTQLSALTAAITGGLASQTSANNTAVDGIANAAMSAEIGKRAVENNYLFSWEAEEKLALQLELQRTLEPEKRKKIQARLDELNATDKARQESIETACPRFGKNNAACSTAIDLAEKAKQSYQGWTDKYQPVGYNSKDKRAYSSIFSYDSIRVNEALKGKDEQTRYKEALAIEIANANNIPLEKAYRIIDSSLTMNELLTSVNGIYAGGKMSSNALKLLSMLEGKAKLPIVGRTTDYEKQTTTINISNGAENVALYPLLKADLAKQQQAAFEKVIKDLSVKPAGSVLMIPDYRTALAEARATLPSQLRTRGNAAIANINIEGLDIKMMAGHSGVDSPTGSFIGEGKAQFKSLELPNKNGKLIDRKVDSEYKIFSNLADRLGSNTQAKGKVIIFTERPACQSCLGVAEQFSKRYPNIKVHIFDNNGIQINPTKGDK